MYDLTFKFKVPGSKLATLFDERIDFHTKRAARAAAAAVAAKAAGVAMAEEQGLADYDPASNSGYTKPVPQRVLDDANGRISMFKLYRAYVGLSEIYELGHADIEHFELVAAHNNLSLKD